MSGSVIRQSALTRIMSHNCAMWVKDIRWRVIFRWGAKTKSMHPEHLQLLLTREMPFGKYQGRIIADLPGHYLNWFARKGFPPGEIGMLLALMQELDHNGLTSLLDPLRKR